MAPKVLCVAPVLPEDVRQYLRALREAGWLHKAVSSFAYTEDGALAGTLRVLDRLAGVRLLHRTQRRRLDHTHAGALVSHPGPEAWVNLGLRLGLCRPGPAATDCWFDGVDRAASRLVRPGLGLVLGREDGCRHTFRAARAVGAVCLYDLPIPHYATMRRVMAGEAAEFPHAVGHFRPTEEYQASRNRRKDAELALADRAVVASPFVRGSLLDAGFPAEQVRVIPYGCEPREDAAVAGPRQSVVLYVGHLSLRKGTLRLLRAWKRLGAHRTHTLRLVGQLQLPPQALAEYAGLYEHVPHVPRSELARHYAAATAFVFPSAADGFGLVLNEALAHGVPVVASTHTGAPGFVTHGREGLIYPHGDDDRLAAALDEVLTSPARTRAMGAAALDLARRWTWREYRTAFARAVADVIPWPQAARLLAGVRPTSGPLVATTGAG